MLELVEEPLDEVALFVEFGAERAARLAIGVKRDIGATALLLDQLNNPVGVVGLITHDDAFPHRLVEQIACCSHVVRLAGCQHQSQRQPAMIDQGMDLGRQSTARPSDRFTAPFFAPAEC